MLLLPCANKLVSSHRSSHRYNEHTTDNTGSTDKDTIHVSLWIHTQQHTHTLTHKKNDSNQIILFFFLYTNNEHTEQRTQLNVVNIFIRSRIHRKTLQTSQNHRAIIHISKHIHMIYAYLCCISAEIFVGANVTPNM